MDRYQPILALILLLGLTGDVDAVVDVTGITGRSVLLDVNPPPPENSGLSWTFKNQNVAVNFPSPVCFDQLIGKCQLYVNGSLRIDSVSSANEGTYYLNVVAPDSSPPDITEYRLWVYAPLDKPVLRIRSDSMYVVDGTNVTLLCDAGGQTVTTYTFYRDQTPICTAPHVFCSGSSLDFTPISEMYSGSYTCRIENPVSFNLSDPINVTVSYRISDISLTVNTSALVWPGLDSVSLRCSARGTNVSYSWSLDGAALPPEPHYVLSADRSVLTISPVSSKDNGSFTCTAANSINNLTSPEVLLHLGCE
ncbi:carcinoembryonic antigen-related cell adhesion molecule 1-like [Bufo gargarizans]|uniref:carcinoembryonic antigen-related cell adhesion molecule 1-like n=1 Tax=Bufo gargarizans TaxID=30331 RepID=UPI001CF566CD|nr:carcinoembryonic antigen-related cell adhesion molecule 1-like [Bufo gargarizans]